MAFDDKSLEWRKPNFFILGAPKCGTTSLAAFLNEHPAICMSIPKEPQYFNTDIGFRCVRSLDEYRKCFAHVQPCHKVIGEASVMYLASREAVPKILQFNPESKFIVMLRNPIEMSYSLHSQYLFTADENVKNFEKAWALQEERLEGKSIPPSCKDPRILQYRRICLLGDQIEYLFSLVPKEKVHVIVMDDMRKNLSTVYEEVLCFLGVEALARKEFLILNESKVSRSVLLTQLINIIASMKICLKIPRTGIGLTEYLRSINSKKHNRQTLNKEFRKELAIEFELDVAKLSNLIGRDLKSWVSVL